MIFTRKWSMCSYGYRQGDWRATDTWEISGPATAKEAIEAAGIPQGAQYPFDTQLQCVSITPKALGPFYFQIVYEYARIGEGDQAPPEIWWDFELVSEPIDRDVRGVPITNSAGDPPDPPLMRDFSYAVLNIARNETAYDPLNALTILNTVNDKAWQPKVLPDMPVFPEGSVILRRYQPCGKIVPKLPWRRIEYQFRIAPDIYSGFWKRLLDAGRSGWWGINGDNVRKGDIVALDSGTLKYGRVQYDVRLNGSGAPIKAKPAPGGFAIGQTAKDPINNPRVVNTGRPPEITEDAVFLYWQVYKASDFSKLML